jgi:hypothetical protein
LGMRALRLTTELRVAGVDRFKLGGAFFWVGAFVGMAF